jgi:chemotaxis protein methyltransferase CheR
VSFRPFNLLQPFDQLGRFDVIFCRNVLIYFSQERKREIIMQIARALHPGGHLFLGSTESMSGHQDLFEMRNLQGGLVYRSPLPLAVCNGKSLPPGAVQSPPAPAKSLK